jgi:integrase
MTEPTQTTHTLADLLDAYERDWFPHLAPRTQYAQRLLYARWRPTLGQVLLRDLTPAYLQSWCRSLQAQYTPTSVRRYLAALSAPLTVAVRYYQWLSFNPMHAVIYPPEGPGRVRFLSQEERNALLMACLQSQNPHLYLVVLLALTTGARKNELLWLRWREVDVERGLLALLQTKNGQSRAVPVTGQALEGLRRRGKDQRPETWVFPRADGLKPVLIEQAWQVARRRARLQDFRFHDLRHTAASYLAMSNATLVEIAAILGHKSLKQTLKYAHLTLSHTTGVVQRMTDKFLTP